MNGSKQIHFKDQKIEKFLKSRKRLRREPEFDHITFRENSNYGWESLLEVIRQNIVFKILLTTPSNVTPLHSSKLSHP